MRFLFPLGLSALTACAPVPIVHRSIDAGWRSPRLAGPPPRSCATSPARKPVPVTVRGPVAHVHIAELRASTYGPPSPAPIRGTSWLLGAAKGEREPVLLHLSARGDLDAFGLPFHPEAAVVAGDRIRLIRPFTSEGPAVWAAIDVSSPDAPKAGPVETIPDLRPKEWVEAFAAGERFALIVSRPLEPPDAPLTASRFRLSTGRQEASYPLGRFDRIADAWCADEGCAVFVGVDGGGLISISFPAEGGTIERLIAEHGALSSAIVPTAAGGLVIWERSGERGVVAQSIDALGEIKGAAVPVSIDGPIHGMVAVRSEDGDALAFRTSLHSPASWQIARVDPAGPSLLLARDLPLLGELFLSAASAAGGALFVGSTSDVSYDQAGTYAFHSWSASVSATFGGEPPVKLLSLNGDGRGGFYGLPVVHGAWAGAVLIPSGDAYPPETVLVSLRAPCGGR